MTTVKVEHERRHGSCLVGARQCKTRVEWVTKHPRDYQWMRHHGYLQNAYDLLTVGDGPQLEFSDREIIEDAKKYPTKIQWKKGSRLYSHARKSRRGDLFTRATSHMTVEPHVQPRKYTDEQLIEAAKPYKKRIDWKRGDHKTYRAAKHQGKEFLNKCCAHMTFVGNRRYFMWQVYTYTWKHNVNETYTGVVYVGITGRPIARHDRTGGHGFRGVVFEYAKKHGEPQFTVHAYPVTMDEAPKLEDEWVQKYKDQGWKVLNTAKPGSRGSCDRKWTVNKVLEDALRYPSKLEWARGNRPAYNAARRHGVFEQATKHMTRPKRCATS